MFRILLLLIGLIIFTDARAENNIAHFVCSEPKGMRVDWGNVEVPDGEYIQKFEEGPKWEEDGFSNVHPEITISKEDMLIKWDGVMGIKAPIARVPIMGRDEYSVWGIESARHVMIIWRYYYSYNLLFHIVSSISSAQQISPPANARIHIAQCKPL